MHLAISTIVLLVLVGGSSSYCPSESSATGEELKKVHESAFSFTHKLFGVLYSESPEENMIASPYSVWQALSVMFYGSRGNTRRQVKKVLKIKGNNRKEFCIQIGKMNDFWHKRALERKDKYTFNVLNKLYFNQSEKLLPTVKKTFLTNEYKLLDFQNDVEKSQSVINEWVESNTNGKIKNLISRLDPMSRLVLVNVVYFKAKWEEVFKEPHTVPDDFHLTDGRAIQTPMMKRTGNFKMAFSQFFESDVIELPYEGGDISMFVFLPKESTETSLEEIINKFTPPNVKKAIQSVEAKRINLFFPKFNATKTFDITDIMKDMGLKDVFDAEKSDLTGFSKKPGMSVNTAVHKAYIQVDESGTEAAAASAFYSFRMSIRRSEDTVKVNHPFVYIIYDKITEVPIFVGTVVDPTLKV